MEDMVFMARAHRIMLRLTYKSQGTFLEAVTNFSRSSWIYMSIISYRKSDILYFPLRIYSISLLNPSHKGIIRPSLGSSNVKENVQNCKTLLSPVLAHEKLDRIDIQDIRRFQEVLQEYKCIICIISFWYENIIQRNLQIPLYAGI